LLPFEGASFLRKELDRKQLEELLSALKSQAALSPYSLTLYRRSPEGAEPAGFLPCCSIVENALCHLVAQQFFLQELDDFYQDGTPAVCRYGGCLYGFVVPFRLGGDEFCLVGDGVRDRELDLWQLTKLSRQEGAALYALFPQLEQIATATFQQVDEAAQEAARRVGKALPASEAQEPQWSGAKHLDPRLVAVAQAQEQLESARTITETVALCCETISTHFPVERLAVALREASTASYPVSGICGLPEELGAIPAESIDFFVGEDRAKRTVPYDARMRNVLPDLQATLFTSFPLRSQGELFGFFAILDREVGRAELLLISLLSHSAAARLSRIVKEGEQLKATALSGRLMSLANSLLMVDKKEELYEAILDIACDLIEADQGSIMLIDKNCENMHIVFTRGMTLTVAQSIPIKVGKGIAGTVARTGEPLLINDVEKVLRVANRPRFKSKSLICIPLKLKKKLIGVLNLSDKKNLAPFTEADLQILTSFANLATLMIERTMVLEESVRYEQLSVTDSLTGLYNRRFLKSRLEEEISRSSRQGLNLTVLFIDLDFFKNYNDLCGHLAGDEALKKTADIIKASVREMDIVARYGGEEFCAVLPGTSKDEAMVVAERIRAEIEAEKFAGDSEIPFRRLTASLGVASFPEDGHTFTALVHASDVALYQAKASGRNNIMAAHTPPSQLPFAPPPEPPAGEAPLAKTLDFNSYLEASLRSKS